MKTKIICSIIIFSILLNLLPIIGADYPKHSISSSDSFYGFIIDVNPEQDYTTQKNIARLVNRLLSDEIPVYWLGSDILINSTDIYTNQSAEKEFLKGSYVIPFIDNKIADGKTSAYTTLQSSYGNLKAYTINHPLENIGVYQLTKPKIAQYKSGSVSDFPANYKLIDMGFENRSILGPDDVINNLTVENYNIFIWGGFTYKYGQFFNDLFGLKAFKVRSKIKDFVKNGGTFIGICYGAWEAASGLKKPYTIPPYISSNRIFGLLPTQLKLIDLPVYRALPGGGNITLKIVNKDNPMTFGLPDYIENYRYAAGPIFNENTIKESSTEVIGVISDIDRDTWYWNTSMMNFYFYWRTPLISEEIKMKISNKWMGDSIGKATWVANKYEKGKVIAFGGHPDYCSLYKGGENSRSSPRLLINAIYYGVSSEYKRINIDRAMSFNNIPVEINDPGECKRNEIIQVSATIENNQTCEYYWEFELPYYWSYDLTDLYDNFYSREHHPKIVYPYGEIYKVLLAVIDNEGNFGIDSIEIYVEYSRE